MLKDPNNWDKLFDFNFFIQHLFALVIAIFAGIVAHIEKIQNKTLKGFQFVVFIYDVVISSFVGLLVLYACLYLKLEIEATAVLIGVLAHQGTRGLALLTNILAKRLGVKNEVK